MNYYIEQMKDIRRFLICIICVLLTVIIISRFSSTCVLSKDINNATKVEIRACTDIGDTLSQRIYDYVQNNNIHNVQALEGKIKGLGDRRLHELMEVYR